MSDLMFIGLNDVEDVLMARCINYKTYEIADYPLATFEAFNITRSVKLPRSRQMLKAYKEQISTDIDFITLDGDLRKYPYYENGCATSNLGLLIFAEKLNEGYYIVDTQGSLFAKSYDETKEWVSKYTFVNYNETIADSGLFYNYPCVSEESAELSDLRNHLSVIQDKAALLNLDEKELVNRMRKYILSVPEETLADYDIYFGDSLYIEPKETTCKLFVCRANQQNVFTRYRGDIYSKEVAGKQITPLNVEMPRLSVISLERVVMNTNVIGGTIHFQDGVLYIQRIHNTTIAYLLSQSVTTKTGYGMIKKEEIVRNAGSYMLKLPSTLAKGLHSRSAQSYGYNWLVVGKGRVWARRLAYLATLDTSKHAEIAKALSKEKRSLEIYL